MAAQNRTVWFPKDSVAVVAASVPVWGVGGLAWGLAMALAGDGQLLKWLSAGMLWGATMWFFSAIYLVIALRELVMSIPVNDTATLQARLSEAVKPGYGVEQRSPTSFLCLPKRGPARFFYCLQMHVRLHEGIVEVTGPAMVVVRVRKYFGQTLKETPGDHRP